MEEWINLLENYSEILTGAAVIFMGLILMIFLGRILRQIKKLNKSLGSITGNMQAYFDVILKEDMESTEAAPTPAVQQSAVMAKEEKREEPMEQELKRMEDEKLFNAVLQEYFS